MAKFSLSERSREQFSEISRFAIYHPWLTICTWLAVGMAGLFAFSSLKYALFPDFTFPLVVVNARASITTALAMEQQVTNPLEASLQDLAGMVVLRSTTTPGQTIITAQYDIGLDMDTATTAVEAAVTGVPLPAQGQVQIIPFNVNEEVAISYALLPMDQNSGATVPDLVDLAEREIVPVLAAVPGVLRVDLQGTGAGVTPPPTSTQAPNPQTKHPATLVRFEGADALAVQVVKQGNANTLEVVTQVEVAVASLKTALPQINLQLATTQADYIREATQATIDALWQAIALAILVIFAFLRDWRSTLITALAIPLSLLATFIVMAVAGFNLETITLLALALVIGIIVDDAIVEVENVIRHIEAGESPRQAALAASREISLTVSVSTLTIVAVFLPVAFMGGTVGQFFKPFGLTVSAAVLASLLIARTLTPVLAMLWLRNRGELRQSDLPSVEASTTVLIPETTSASTVTRWYGRLLTWALGHRGWVVAVAIAAFSLGVALIPFIPQGFIPKLDRGEFNVVYTSPLPDLPNLAAANRQPSAAVADRPALAQPPSQADQSIGTTAKPALNPLALILADSREVAKQLEEPILATEDVASVFTIVGNRGAPNQGQLYVRLQPQRTHTTAEVQDQIRASLPRLPGVTTSVEDIAFVDTGGGKPLQVILEGNDLADLTQASQTVRDQVATLPGFVDVTVTGETNTVDEIVDITHRNSQRVAYIEANLSQGQALGDATRQVVDIAQATIPPSVKIGLGADSARIGEVLGSFLRTLVLAVILMLVVVFIPFGRLLEPLVVGLSLPLAIVGAMAGFLITQSDFGMASVIGLLFLLGLLDKNALLLMDYANQLRQAGLSRQEALVKSGQVRFRPILMTTASTILGMLPIAIGLGAGAELRQPMAVAIIGGLLTSTLLSLLVVPVLYTLLEDGWANWSQRGRS